MVLALGHTCIREQEKRCRSFLTCFQGLQLIEVVNVPFIILEVYH